MTFLIWVGVCQRAKDYDDVQFLGLLLYTLLSNKVISLAWFMPSMKSMINSDNGGVCVCVKNFFKLW